MKPEIKWLDDPEVFRVGQLPAHSDHRFYESEEACQTGASGLVQSLNGSWQFCWSENAASRPADFYREDGDESRFGTIQVPGHMELAGYDRIHYINTMYPWEGQVYRRPAFMGKDGKAARGQFSQAEYNPVGSYRLRFDLNQELLGKRVCISFQGVEQAMYVWLNGFFVGYAEDSFTPSDFDLSPYIRDKGNLLAVEVHKRSTAAYLEDQDFFRFSGIFRSVFLYAKPELHLEDLWARTGLNEDGVGGTFRLELLLSAEKQAGALGGSIGISLKDRDGKTVLEKELAVKKIPEKGKRLKSELVRLKQVRPWCHQDPYLYHLEIRIAAADGRLVEIVPYEIGFCRLALKHGVMELNGKRLIIKGVNRHEWSAEGGRVITQEDMQWDLDCLLKNNVNSVRTCHYPNQIPWYYMCDQAGMYLMAETNLESHGSWQKMGTVDPSWNVPGSSPRWREAVLDRVKTNFETFKNHVSILFWSLGNESYAGDDIRDMQAWLKEQKDGRLVHYEGVSHNRAYADSISDVESQMYTSPERVAAFLEENEKKPFLLCEYMHDMGNSLGGMKSYMDLLDRYERYQGGFIWDFIDQALYVKDPVTGQMVLRYGGDFDDRPSDYEFSGDGLVFANRVPKPAMQEVRYYYGRY